MNTIKTVVFDLGGVLVDLDIDRCTGAFRSLGMDAVADLINPYYPAEMIGRLEHGVISFHEACDEMRRLSGTPEITDAQIAWAYGQFLVRIPVAKLRQIDALRERGIRTCVLSNNNPASMKYIRRMFTADGKTMDDYFDAVFLSYELHELTANRFISDLIRSLSDAHNEVLYYLFVRQYSTARLAVLRAVRPKYPKAVDDHSKEAAKADA